MIEVSCGKCGATQRIDAASVPPGGKVIKCSSCGRLVRVPSSAKRTGATPPPGSGQAKGGAKSSVKLGPPGLKDFKIPTPKPVESVELGRFTEAKVPDVPAPKSEAVELGRLETKGTDLPAPRSEAVELGHFSDSSEGADLPAPKAEGVELGRFSDSRGSDLPAPRSEAVELGHFTDSGSGADLPAPKSGGVSLGRLSDRSDDAELPAPVAKLGGPPGSDDDSTGLPAPARTSRPGMDVSDLPAPAGDGSKSDILDLPAPAANTGSGPIDLPAPISGSKPDINVLDLSDALEASDDATELPAPADMSGRGAADLPAPVAANTDSDNALDLSLSDGGFFDDIPAPAEAPNALDLGAGDTSGSQDEPMSLELDDLDFGLSSEAPSPAQPGPLDAGPADAASAGGQAESSASLDFLDIGAPEGSSGADSAGPIGDAIGLDLGLDSDAPASDPPAAGGSAASAGASLGSLDIGLGDSDDSASGSAPLDFGDLGLGDSDDSASGSAPLDFGLPEPSGGDAGSMDLGLPEPVSFDEPKSASRGPGAQGASGAGGSGYDDVGLPTPDAGAGSDDLGLAIDKPAPKKPKQQQTSKKAATAARLSRALSHSEEEVDLAVDTTALQEAKGGAKKAQTVAAAEAPVAKGGDKPKRRSRIIAAAAVLVVLGLGAGGYFGYNHWQQQKAREAGIAEGLGTARLNMLSDRGGHWGRAAKAAGQALSHDADHAEALGLAAQAHYAAFLDQGTAKALAQVRKASPHIKRINEKSLQGPDVDKALALQALVEQQAARAIDLLNGVLEASPAPDPDALLYLGWAQASAGKHRKAIKSFNDALAASQRRKIPALYGLARSQLALGEIAEARESFAQVLELDAEHLGAQVGAAQAADIADPREREERYLSILKRPNIDELDLRAVSQAWTLAGTLALRAGRLDDAKSRFAKALERNEGNVEARVGLARVALGQDRLKETREILTKVLEARPDHVGAMLTAAELAQRESKLDEAQSFIDKLLQAEQGIHSRLARANMHYIHAQLLHARVQSADQSGDEGQNGDNGKNGQNGEAGDAVPTMDQVIEAYERAHELAGTDDIRPAVALAALLSQQERKEEARAMLEPLQAKAANDASLAITLGQVYASSDAPVEAEQWFRKALELRPEDAEATFQLGLALRAQGRDDEALETIAKAYQADDSRADIGVELALTYEAKGRDDDARKIYVQLLDAGEPSMTLLEHAGRFFVRTGDPRRASELGELILKQKDDSALGLYLRGEGRYHDKDYANALRSFRDAALIEENPRYIEAQGRAAEKVNNFDEALRSYAQASALDPSFLAPLIGEARVRVGRRDFDRALTVLEKARSIDARSAAVYHYMGVCNQEQGELKEAAKQYERALRYDRKRAETHYRLGQVYFDLDKQRDAASALTAATRLAEPDAPWLAKAYLNLGYAQRSRGNRREAINAWEEYLALEPDNSAEVQEVKRLLMRLKAQ